MQYQDFTSNESPMYFGFTNGSISLSLGTLGKKIGFSGPPVKLPMKLMRPPITGFLQNVAEKRQSVGVPFFVTEWDGVVFEIFFSKLRSAG
jgi:hypothetical protein